jgi:hypothetical protein
MLRESGSCECSSSSIRLHAHTTKYRPLMGKHIVARGSLFTAQTGHHHTDVLLTVSELRASN